MSPFAPLPPQVRVVCDRCGCELEMDGIKFHFDAGDISGVADYEWTVRGERVYCFECGPPVCQECGEEVGLERSEKDGLRTCEGCNV